MTEEASRFNDRISQAIRKSENDIERYSDELSEAQGNIRTLDGERDDLVLRIQREQATAAECMNNITKAESVIIALKELQGDFV